MKIVCATDFTRHSHQAALAAAAIAGKCGGELELVHVSETPSKRFPFEHEATLTRTIAEGASVRLEELARRLTHHGVEPTWKLLLSAQGHALAGTILQHAIGANADLLVISTHGKSGSKLWPMGSLALAIVEIMPMPVLVVQTAKAFLPWQEGTGPPMHVFVGLDLSAESGGVLEALPRFRFDEGSKITAGFAQQLYPVPDDFYSAPLAILPYAEEEAHLENRIRQQVAQHLKNAAAEVTVETGFSTPAHQLVEMAQHGAADLIIIGTHQRHGLDRLLQGSVSRGVLRESSASVLCVPLHSRAEPPAPLPGPPAEPSIFCATDFSDRSSEAALAAQELALRLGTRLEIAYVVENHLAWPGLPDDVAKTIRAGAIARLDQFAGPLAQRGLTPKTTLLDASDHDSVADCILKHLQTAKPLLAVVSTHGKSGGSWWPLGSTAMKLAGTSPVPVLVVQSSEAIRRWIESGTKLQVLGAVDAHGENAGVLQWMQKLGEAGPCSFTLAHISQALPSSLPPGASDPRHLPEAIASLTLLEHRLKVKARSILGEKADLTILVKPTWQGVVDALLDIVLHTPTDLIIVGADQWHGLGRLIHESISRGLVSRSEVSLLCLPLPNPSHT